MDGTNGLVLWILGGAGITLLYSAYKKKSPLTVLTNHVSSSTAAAPSATGGAAATAVPKGTAYSVGKDASGVQYVYDANGNPLSVMPANYDNTPSTYIPVG